MTNWAGTRARSKALAEIRKAGQVLAVLPVAFGPTGTFSHWRAAVWFSNGAAVDRDDYDHILLRYPLAEFRNAGLDQGLLIYDGEQLVGALMPLQPAH